MKNTIFWAIYDSNRLPIRFFLLKKNCTFVYRNEYSDEQRNGLYYGEYRVPIEDE